MNVLLYIIAIFLCGQCTIMSTSEECVCYKEIANVVDKLNELDDSSVGCITEHPGFNSVCGCSKLQDALFILTCL